MIFRLYIDDIEYEWVFPLTAWTDYMIYNFSFGAYYFGISNYLDYMAVAYFDEVEIYVGEEENTTVVSSSSASPTSPVGEEENTTVVSSFSKSLSEILRSSALLLGVVVILIVVCIALLRRRSWFFI